MPRQTDTGSLATDWVLDKTVRSLITMMLILPYRWRVPAMGWIMARILAPVAGYNRRSADNLKFIHPDMPARQRRKIVTGVADNMGRTFIENYSTSAFAAHLKTSDISGPGVQDLDNAQKTGRPVILATGHFGNYEAPRVALLARGYNVGGLFRRAKNRYFNEHYEKTFVAVGGPVFAQGRKGNSGFVRHLARGGMLVLLFDQHFEQGAHLPFLGKPAATALSAARLALRYDALLIPFYGTRRRDGLSFDISFEKPVPHSDAETMTRALNESIQARIQTRPEQWLWVHRRWKINRETP